MRILRRRIAAGRGQSILDQGTKLGPFEIVTAVGAGGMGEVYRARDTRLDRTVAIKVLPSHLSSDPELKQRFEREARAISSLQHPNICTLYDVGSQDGVDFLVLEYLEGRTLSERLTDGALPLNQVVEIGVEIAKALEKAHQHGIVHRDLKPGNIMLTTTGTKLLDFGLAKPVVAMLDTTPSGSSTPTMSLESLTSPAVALTQQGTIVGTFQYTAPEVLQGREADARSDLFSFGCVMYEMVTGRKAFEGRSQLGSLTAILENEPEPISAVRPDSPSGLEEVICTCVAKDPEDRYGCAHDVKLALQSIKHHTAIPPKRTSRMPWVIAAAASVIALVLAAGHWSAAIRPKTVVRSSVLAPPGTTLELLSTGSGPPVFSPDGTRLAFTARDDKGKVLLYLRRLDAIAAQPLEGTDDARYPFWSPDGREIGFFAGTKLKRIGAAGGPASVICDAPNGRGGSWSNKGIIVFTPAISAGLFKVPVVGGLPEPASKLMEGQNSHRWPFFLPDGEHFLYWARSSRAPQENALYVGALGSLEPTLLSKGDSMAIYVSGYLLFVRQQELMALHFNPRNLKSHGEPIPIAQHVAINAGVNRPVFSASAEGSLIYATGDTAGGWRVLKYDRQGRQIGAVGELDHYYDPALSPDGNRLAVSLFSEQGSSDIWVFDLLRGTRTRLTFGAAVRVLPVWAPDGKTIYYSSNAKGTDHVYATAADGSGAEAAVLESGDFSEAPHSITADRRYLLCQRRSVGGESQAGIWAIPLSGDRKPFPVVRSAYDDVSPSVSPNGQWLAYMSNESGRMEIYLTRFPGGQAKWEVSTNGGLYPKWRKDGKELFFIDEGLNVLAVDVDFSSGKVKLGVPHTLFHPAGMQFQQGPYEVSADGKLFLINSAEVRAGSEPLILVQNWTSEIERR